MWKNRDLNYVMRSFSCNSFLFIKNKICFFFNEYNLRRNIWQRNIFFKIQ